MAIVANTQVAVPTSYLTGPVTISDQTISILNELRNLNIGPVNTASPISIPPSTGGGNVSVPFYWSS